jgi:amidohydrolase
MPTCEAAHDDIQPATLRKILAAIDADSAEVLELARWMAAHPELSLEEHATGARYREFLTERGFRVEDVADDLPTAFIAQRGADDAPVRLGLLAEMDALPEIGHACGHNLSGPASLLAAHAAAEALDETEARIVVIGCPAEETGLGKRRLVELGVFEGLDVAMMAHASDMRRAHRLFLGNQKFELVFHGRASHAAAYPEAGINALDGVIAFFVSLGLLRQQLPREVRVHGIVSDGGQAPNVIPERAAARVWVRSLDEELIAQTSERVLACAKGAAQACAAQLEVLEEAGHSPPMHPNLELARCYGRQLARLGLEETAHAPGEAIGSSDITHVSRVVPTIHPNFPIGEGLQLHTRAFAQATTSPQGEAGLLEAARALALTAAELALDPALRAAVKDLGPTCV